MQNKYSFNAQCQDQTNNKNRLLDHPSVTQFVRIYFNCQGQNFRILKLIRIEGGGGYLNNEFGLKTILLLNISKNSSSFIFPSG